MPQIKEYTQRVGIEGGFNTTSVNPQTEGSFGRGLQQIGGAIADVGKMLYEVQGKKEASDASAKMFDLQEKMSERMRQESTSGSFNLEKFNQDYDNQVSQISNGYSTAYGSEHTNKISTQIKQSLNQDALKVTRELTAVKFKADTEQAKTSMLRTVFNSPSSAEIQKAAFAEHIKSIAGDANPKLVEQLAQSAFREIDMESVKGQIRLSKDGELDSIFKNLSSDKRFDGKEREQLEAEVNQEKSRREANASRIDRLNNKARETHIQARLSAIYDGIQNDTISPDDILKEKIPFEYKEKMLNIVKRDKARDVAINDQIYSQKYYSQIMDGTLKDPILLSDAYVRGEIKQETMNKLSKSISFFNRPEGAQYKDDLRNLNKTARAQLVTDSFGVKDPDGEMQYSKFQLDMQKMFEEKRLQGVSADELLDPSAKTENSLYKLISRYKRTTQEKIQTMKTNMGSDSATPKFKSIEDYEKSKGK